MEETVQKYSEGVLRNILYFLSVAGNIEASEDERTIKLNIVTADSGILIGHRGENLKALEHLVNVMVRNEHGPGHFVRIDVGGYREEQEKKIENLARAIALRVKQTGRSEVLRPMTPAERRLIHTVVSEYGEIESESTGDEPYRRIVIRKKA